MTTPSLEDLFTKYGKIYNVDKELLKKIAGCESGFNPNAVNNDYAGLFQFASFAWIEARGRIGLNNDLSLRFNAEESIKTAAFEINYKGTSGWSDCDK
jgi:soluble lytic murein transglycosylase-like protein